MKNWAEYEAVGRDVRDVVYGAASAAVNGAVYVTTAVDWPVTRAVHWAVGWNVHRAMGQDPAHPAIQDFLREVEA
jgi:hypothetical protein